MNRNIQRTIIIWIALLVAFYYVYPTVGWMLLSESARQERLERWKQEDDQLAREHAGYWTRQLASWKRWLECDRSKVINLGLDLQGGIHMVVGFDIRDLPEERLKQYRDSGYSDADIEREIQQIVLERVTTRINEFEAKEPIIQTLGTNQIQIQLPGEKDVQRAKSLITRMAQLNFHIVAGPDQATPVFKKIRDAFPEDFVPFVKMSQLRSDTLTVSMENYERVKSVIDRAMAANIIPPEKMVAFSQRPKPYEKQEYQLYVLDRQPIASGEGLVRAHAMPDQSNPGKWMILFEFNAASSAHFAEVTGNNVGNAMAIVLDGVVVSAPTIQERISGGRGQITGNFDAEEAKDLATCLNSGSMDVPLREEFTRTVSASLGREAIRKGVLSSLSSLVIVAAFMMVYYNWAGVLAVIGLAVNALFIIAAMAYFNLTLTLPGIAGLVLTIGMAVDANVLIYERIREELKLGHTLASSIENGFRRAAATILDANITTLIAGAVLLQFGTGPIKGFAVTLSIGVCTTLFVALVVTKAMFDFVMNRRMFRTLRMLQAIPSNPGIPFMEWRRPVISVSVLVILVGMGWFAYRGMDNFGVDFQQGTNLVLWIDNPEPVSADAVRQALNDAGFNGPVVQETQDEQHAMNLFNIRVGDLTRQRAANEAADAKSSAELATVADRIRTVLTSLQVDKSIDKVVVEDEQTVGPAVGTQLRWDALLSMFWSFVFVIIYLWVRFELRFSLGAVVATLHDMLITMGIFSLLGQEISMGVIAALLTILGYSLNDTIVVFDRIREEMQLSRGKGVKLIDLMNKAINVTLSRTILTSLTTLFVTVVLLIFGGDSLFDFALVLTIGIVVGTYSSIFIASPVVLMMENIRVASREARQENAGGRRIKAEPGTGKARA